MAFSQQDIQAEYESHSAKKELYLNSLKPLIINSGSSLEGNSFYIHQTLNLHPQLYTKQLNLFWCGKQAQTRICEIGFNAGHSSMLMLLGRDTTPLEFTVFDIGQHRYTKPCLEYIQAQFPHVHFEYIEGDSTVTMPSWIEANKQYAGLYDVVHVDGGHTLHCITNDMKNADLLVKNGGILIIDDTNFEYINACADEYIATGRYTEVHILKTVGYPHRAIRKIK